MSKYKAIKTDCDNIIFDSHAEMLYYVHLKELKTCKMITDFELQPKYILQAGFNLNGKSYRKIEYVSDFLIYELDGSKTVVDIKGFPTTEAKLKRKLFMYKFPLLKLEWLVWYGGQWVDYFENQRRISKNKSLKKKLIV